ncbi:hypothetical protein BH11BAC1_BH11BAC1_17180 [soil metagenome]
MVANSRTLFLLFLIILGTSKINSGQTKIPVLERTVSITVANEMLQTVLDQISKQGHFSFSFNPAIMDLKKAVTIKMKDKSVREVLEHLLSPDVKYKMRGEHIILTKAPVTGKISAPSYYLISGYVTDGNNGNKIPEVSIYDRETRSSSVTNSYGYYELKVDRKTNAVQLTVNKQQFKDTLIYVKQSGNTIINVTIYPEEKLPEPVDSSAIKVEQIKEDQLAIIDFMLSQEQKANTRNVKDTLYKKFQLAFLPFVGSNLRLSGNTVNDYSVNVLAGYSMGTRKLEIAGLINIDRDSVQSIQIAGLINATGGPVNGIQLGGLINANMKTTKGVQLAGLLNCDGDTVRGFQAAGMLNVNLGDVYGVNAGGLLNAAFGKTEGVQVAGLLNFSLKEIDGAQVAGLLNVAANDIAGTQISGLVNYASRVKGSQLGFLNISDSCSGIAVGFLSFSRKGYHTIEINADEVFPVNLAFRTGLRSFYNIFTAGIQTKNLDIPLWHYGYGLGTSVNLGKKWWLNFDLTAQQLLKGSTFQEINLLGKFNVTLDKSLGKKFALAFGPTFNFYASNTTAPYYSVFDKLPPYTFSNQSYSNDLNIKMWVGGKVALRFL